jgi:amino acid transporter
MGPDQLVFFWLILSTLGICVMIFGIRYLNNKENLAMIEKGMDPKIKQEKPRPAPFRNLKWGLLLLGAGLGFFLAYILDNFAFYNVKHVVDSEGANVPIYFALIAIGGGIGLVLSYRIERKAFPPGVAEN